MIPGPFIVVQPRQLSSEEVRVLRERWEASFRGVPVVLGAPVHIERLPRTRVMAVAFLVVFYRAIVVGLALGLLIGSLIVSALSSASSTVSPLTSAVDGALVRAAHSPSDRMRRSAPLSADELGASTEPARTTSHADDTLAASEVAPAPQPNVLTTHGLRDDPPAPVVLGSSFSTKIEVAKQEPLDIEATIRSAAAEFGVDADELVRVAFCESSFRPLAVGRAQEIGVLQFLPRTFEANARRLGYTIADITDVRAQARVAAEMWSRDQAWQWSCAR